MRTALVTGGAGFIGSHLVEALLDCDYRVHAFDNCTTGFRSNLSRVWGDSDFAFTEADIRDPSAVIEAMTDVDTVFHLAAATSVPGSFDTPGRTTSINCTGTANVFEAARDAAVETVVFASSAAVYGSEVPVPVDESVDPNPESPYALSKRYGEELANQLQAESTLETVAVRFFNVYGPRQDPSGEYAAVIPAFIERMLEGDRPVIYGDGEQTRDFVYIGDVVDACLQAAESNASGSVCNIAAGERFSINELVSTLNDVLDTDLEPIYADPRPGDIRHSGADISHAEELFGYEPSKAFREGLAKTVEWYT